MKKKNTFAKFEGSKLKETKNIKGGFRAANNSPGGSGGSSWIDWGDMDIRFEQINTIKNNRLGTAFQG